MAKNSFSNLRKQSLSSKPTALVAGGQDTASSSHSAKTAHSDGLKSESLVSKRTDLAIGFGKPSNNKAPSTTSTSGSEWSNLLKQTASGGIASALSGSFGLGSIGGIGSIVSGIMNLFGGGKSSKHPLAPLPEFSLPGQQALTGYVTTQGINVHQGISSQVPGSTTAANGIYGPSQAASPASGASRSGIYGASSSTQISAGASSEWIQSQGTQIAQAVRTALLNSSSLNDVIAEI